ncbi:hypothetical protein ACWEO1_19045 [Kitasatospora cineracea]
MSNLRTDRVDAQGVPEGGVERRQPPPHSGRWAIRVVRSGDPSPRHGRGASFLSTAVRNGLDPAPVAQWLTVPADATGSPVLSHLGSTTFADCVDRRRTVVLAGPESTTRSPHPAG